MWPFTRSDEHKRIRELEQTITELEQRSLAVADVNATKLPLPQFTQWTIERGVRNGYQASGWVYLAVSKIMQAVASVPFVVRKMEDDSIDWEHPVTMLLQKPNPQWSRQNQQKIVTSWLQLSGNGFMQRIIVSGKTAELWPISPDIIAPVLADHDQNLIQRYEGQGGKPRFDPHEIVHLRLIDPANPALGISPLQAAGRAVDTDIELANFNKAAAQNRGVMDGLIMLKEGSQKQADTIREKLLERMTRLVDRNNARLPGVIGAQGEYIQIGNTPAELDFLGGRSFSRDEIYQIYGIPLALMGVTESSTYNNMETAPRTFWRETIVPLLKVIADDIDFSLRQEIDDLGEDYYVDVDLSQVPALKQDAERQAAITKIWFDAGVPLQQINNMMQLGIEEFSGWDIPWNGSKQPQQPAERKHERRYKLRENRQTEVEDLLSEQITVGPAAELWQSILDRQQAVIFSVLERSGNIDAALAEMRPQLMTELNKFYVEQGLRFSDQIIIEQRNAGMFDEPSVEQLIIDMITAEALALKVFDETDADTVRMVGEQIADLLEQGATTGQIQQAIIDAGVFNEDRALMLARTASTQAQSVGLLSAGQAAGATHKRWSDSGIQVRPSHQKTNGQRVRMDQKFTMPRLGAGGVEHPGYPGDPVLTVANRANCRCSLTFEIDEESTV